MIVDRFLAWAQLYSKEEPTLKLIHRIVKPDFPNIGLGFPSTDGIFPGGFILLKDSMPTAKEEANLMLLTQQGYFVMAVSSWQKAAEMTLIYFKVDNFLNVLDERFLPDEISLN